MPSEARYSPLGPPRSSWQEVRRKRLLRELSASRDRKLIVISAPAGYGKTSVAAQWFHDLGEDGHATAWVSLEPEDREQAHFLANVIRALDPGRKVKATAYDLDAQPVETLMQLLKGCIGTDDREVVLFLDDYHLVQADPIETLVFKLIKDPLMERLKIVLITRGLPSIPLSRLRLEGKYRQFGVDDLRLTDAETHELLNAARTDMNQEGLAAVVAQTEGWAVALQMVRLLLAERPEDPSIWSNLGHRDGDMGRYLMEQVISNLPEEVCDLLYRTAAVPTLCADLAVAITGDPRARAEFMDLLSQNLPISTREDRGLWVRYHPLFREFLRERASIRGEDETVALARAAGWFRERGDVRSAIRHAMLAGDSDLAVQIVEGEGGWRLVYLTARGGMSIFSALMEHVSTIELTHYPLTTLGLAVINAKRGRVDAARHYLEQVRRADPPPNIGRQARMVDALLSLYDDRRLSLEQLTLLEHDLSVDHDMGLVHRGLLLNLLSFNYLNRGRFKQARAYGEQSFRCLKDCGAEFGALHLHFHVGQALFLSGDTSGAFEAYSRLIDEARANLGQGSDMEAIGQILLTELLVEGGQFEGVNYQISWALDHVERNDTWFDILAAGLMTQLKVALVKENYQEAHRAIDHAREAAKRRRFNRLHRLCDAERVRVLLAERDDAEAQRLAQSAGLGPDQALDFRKNELASRLRGSVPALLWARHWIDTGKLEHAQEAIEKLKTMQPESMNTLRLIEIAALELRLAVAENDFSRAAGLLSDLALGTPISGYCATLFAEGRRLIADLERLASCKDIPATVRERVLEITATSDITSSASPLTGREREIMALLVEGLTNKEIGHLLSMSENTVKFHLRNLFGKLEVSNRTAAVAAARDLGLLR